MTTFQIKLFSEDRLVAPRPKTPEDPVPTEDATQLVGGRHGAPSDNVNHAKQS